MFPIRLLWLVFDLNEVVLVKIEDDALLFGVRYDAFDSTALNRCMAIGWGSGRWWWWFKSSEIYCSPKEWTFRYDFVVILFVVNVVKISIIIYVCFPGDSLSVANDYREMVLFELLSSSFPLVNASCWNFNPIRFNDYDVHCSELRSVGVSVCKLRGVLHDDALFFVYLEFEMRNKTRIIISLKYQNEIYRHKKK